MLTCEDELEDKCRHVSTSISSEIPSGPQKASQVATLLHTSFEFIASFLWAPPVHSDSVFCCSGTASGDPQGVVTIESLKYHQSSPYIWGGAEHTRVHTCIHRKNTEKTQNKTKQITLHMLTCEDKLDDKRLRVT